MRGFQKSRIRSQKVYGMANSPSYNDCVKIYSDEYAGRTRNLRDKGGQFHINIILTDAGAFYEASRQEAIPVDEWCRGRATGGQTISKNTPQASKRLRDRRVKHQDGPGQHLQSQAVSALENKHSPG